ncbi:MAG: cell division protein FtsQ/DivIB [Gammaproteobacteria bacterium]|nr:cell division protein FtsQ/DivIB [Gammaproteobacteria bacterium]
MARRRRQGVRQVEREAARQRLRRVFAWSAGGGTLALVIGAFASGLVSVPLPEAEFPLRTLRVESAFERVSREEILAVVRPHAADGFFGADMAGIRQGLVELPWIRAASVRRVWPDTLQVTLIEEHAVARWGDGGLVNGEGEVFHPPRAEGAGLPLLVGPESSAPQVVAFHREAQRRLEPLGLRIATLAMDARRSWEMTLANGIRLTLGSKDAERQIARFVEFYPRVLAARAAEIERIDLRYGNGFAVRWQAAATAANANGHKMTGDSV